MKGQACTEGGRCRCQKDESIRISQVLLPPEDDASEQEDAFWSAAMPQLPSLFMLSVSTFNRGCVFFDHMS